MAEPTEKEEATPVIGPPLVGVVGPCGSGKSTLVVALRAHGIHAREIAQEHSYVPAMWQRFTHPDLLIYLAVSHETAERRLGRRMPDWMWKKINQRLRHANDHADLMVDTDPLSPAEVLERALQFLEQRTVDRDDLPP